MAEQNPLLSRAPNFLLSRSPTLLWGKAVRRYRHLNRFCLNRSKRYPSPFELGNGPNRDEKLRGCSGAIGDCSQAIKLDDSRWQPHYCMRLAYFHLKKYKDAKSALFKGANLAAGYSSWFDDLILNCNDADAELPVDAAANEVVPPVNELLKMLATQSCRE